MGGAKERREERGGGERREDVKRGEVRKGRATNKNRKRSMVELEI